MNREILSPEEGTAILEKTPELVFARADGFYEVFSGGQLVPNLQLIIVENGTWYFVRNT